MVLITSYAKGANGGFLGGCLEASRHHRSPTRLNTRGAAGGSPVRPGGALETRWRSDLLAAASSRRFDGGAEQPDAACFLNSASVSSASAGARLVSASHPCLANAGARYPGTLARLPAAEAVTQLYPR